MKKMKDGKARDESGVVAEMLKQGTQQLHEAVLDLFNDILQDDREAPEQWWKTRLIVIFKKGERNLPGNYRPIAILPTMYKLFSRMLCARIQVTLMKQQSVDQAAYRPGFSAEDHLLTVSLLTERCNEWNIEVWFGLADFEKAFDTVEHDAMWKALEEQGMSQEYVHILKKLYRDQTAYVQAGVASRKFTLSRGVKQGDPISALLFIAVMEACFRTLKQKWHGANQRRQGQYFGIVIDSPEDPLTNLRFADDVLLFAHSRQDIVKMISHLSEAAAKYGLKLHVGKTNVLTNIDNERRPDKLPVGEGWLKVLREDEAERYLGRKLCLNEHHAAELSHRFAAGWASFMKNKAALCNRSCSLRSRLRAFDAIVTPTVLYGASSWAMTTKMEQLLCSTRRRMLRYIVGVRRKQDETWVEYIKRATHTSMSFATTCGVQSWIEIQRRKKWRIAGKAARCSEDRWCKRILNWQPWFRCNPKRDVGRPRTRWNDDIVSIAGESWTEAAADQAFWRTLEDGYLNKQG
jgi:hypothetical protein